MAELKRTLGFWMTSAFTFLNLVNTGIFFSVGLAFAVAGEASILAWFALGLFSVYTAMCFSELTTMFPAAGGVYEFAKQAYGRLASFQVGWLMWIINNIATALLVVAAVTYLLPDHLLESYFPLSPAMVKLILVILIIVALNYVAYRGADDSARLMVVLALFTLVLIAIVFIPGLRQIHAGEFLLLNYDWKLLLVAAFLVSETFFGWESISFMAEEIVEPEKNIPRALIWTSAFVAISSVVIAAITIAVLGSSSAQAERPLIEVLSQLGVHQWLIFAANLGIVVTFLGNAAGGVIGNPRLLMALSRDKLFIEQFADVHERYLTPYKGIFVQTIVAILIAIMASGAYQKLLELLVAPSIILYASMIVLVPLFRWKRPAQARPYKTPFGSWLPLLLVGFFLLMLGVWAATDPGAVQQIRLLASFLVFSIPIYMLLTYFYDPDVLVSTINKFSFLNLWLEDLLVPKRVRREVLDLLPDAQGKSILEFGSGVGSLTMHLAEHVGAKGRVYAVDFSERNLRLLDHRLAKRNHSHVRTLCDPHLVNRIHPDITEVDMIVSIGSLGYVQDVRKVLKEMADILPHRGHICFVEYIGFFYFLPDPKWLTEHDRLRELFGECGFNIQIEVRKGLLWKYMYVYGVKEHRKVPYI